MEFEAIWNKYINTWRELWETQKNFFLILLAILFILCFIKNFISAISIAGGMLAIFGNVGIHSYKEFVDLISPFLDLISEASEIIVGIWLAAVIYKYMTEKFSVVDTILFYLVSTIYFIIAFLPILALVMIFVLVLMAFGINIFLLTTQDLNTIYYYILGFGVIFVIGVLIFIILILVYWPIGTSIHMLANYKYLKNKKEGKPTIESFIDGISFSIKNLSIDIILASVIYLIGNIIAGFLLGIAGIFFGISIVIGYLSLGLISALVEIVFLLLSQIVRGYIDILYYEYLNNNFSKKNKDYIEQTNNENSNYSEENLYTTDINYNNYNNF
jgi:hypothetical protein